MEPTKRIVLLYQNGIANVFAVDSFELSGRPQAGRNAFRLMQHTFEPCRWFAAGMGTMGAVVRTFQCTEPGNATDLTWNPIGDDTPFQDKVTVLNLN